MSDALSRRVGAAVTIVSLAGAVYYGTVGGAYALNDIRDLERRVEARERDVETMTEEWLGSRRRADSLETEAWSIERVARERYGFIRPGELLVRFVEVDGTTGRDTGRSERAASRQ
ncbi:MAG: septum formation initiator family protein [Gemmatimonadetes bacterium]|nr:septum formation initiator family protein [Gemmatimonadota bacterium]